MAYIIYSETEFESPYGQVHKGDEINTIHGGKSDEMEIRQWLISQYVLDGIDISYRIAENGRFIGKKKRITQEKLLKED